MRCCREQEAAAKLQQDLLSLSADKAASAAALQAAEERLRSLQGDLAASAAQLQAAEQAGQHLQVSWGCAVLYALLGRSCMQPKVTLRQEQQWCQRY